MTTNHQTLRELADKATPGPEHIYRHPRDHNNWQANAYFQAACDPETILALLDDVEALRADAERWRQARDNQGDGLRLIKWNHSAIEELQVLFPSPILCDEYADQAINAARHAQGDKA